MRAAAKAMEKPLVLDDVEGWRFLVVERAKPALFTAAPDQPHPPPDQVGKRHAAAQLVEKAGREGHLRYRRHCEERSDEAIPIGWRLCRREIASLRSQ